MFMVTNRALPLSWDNTKRLSSIFSISVRRSSLLGVVSAFLSAFLSALFYDVWITCEQWVTREQY